MAALEPRNDTLELRRVRTLPAVPVPVPDVDGPRARTLQHRLLVALAQLPPRRVHREPVLAGHRAEHPVEVLAAESRPRCDRAVGDAEVVVVDHELGVDLEARPEPVATLARSVRRVEREIAGRELLERQPAIRARQMLREGQHLAVLVVLLLTLPRHDLDLGDSFGEAQRGLERIGQAPLDAVAPYQPVDDDLDRVLLVAGEAPAGIPLEEFGQLDDLAVDSGPGEPLPRQLRE